MISVLVSLVGLCGSIATTSYLSLDPYTYNDRVTKAWGLKSR
jgi:hypothetical protein